MVALYLPEAGRLLLASWAPAKIRFPIREPQRHNFRTKEAIDRTSNGMLNENNKSMTTDLALGFEKKKKKKKSKPAMGEAARPNGTQSENLMALQSEIIKKKKKKDKNIELNSQPPMATADVPVGEPGKKKKKKRKAANAEGEITEAKATLHQPADAQGSVPDQPEKRKKRKNKSEQPSGQPELAAVGDRELARSGKPIVKDLYTEHAAVAALTPAEVDAWRGERETVVTGRDMKPVIAFDQAGFSADLLQSTRTFAQPSPIQAQCWPIIQSGNDLVGIAATGSGKTLAFGLPGLKHILAQKAAGVSTGKHPTALVLAPTRELAQQIAIVLDEAGQAAGLRTLCVYGGVPKPPQTAALRKGVDVVVATPGRLEDLINDGACRLSGITYLVLDEADRMLDLGFEPHIRAIAGATRADRQTLMFSATWPPAIQKLASEFQASPTRVTIGSQDLSASHSVRQIVEVIDPAARDRRLEELLRKYHASRKNRVLVFVLYKKEAARVEAQLSKRGWNVRAIHGDINQRQRSEAVEHFKSGTCPLLIATDVAARGLDIPDVEAVINYSFPLTTEDYVHRIGRTGRAGKSGLSHTFFSGASDKARAGELINVLREANQEVPEELLKFGTTVKRKEHKLFGAHFKDVDFTKKATKVSFDSDDE